MNIASGCGEKDTIRIMLRMTWAWHGYCRFPVTIFRANVISVAAAFSEAYQDTTIGATKIILVPGPCI